MFDASIYFESGIATILFVIICNYLFLLIYFWISWGMKTPCRGSRPKLAERNI